MSSVRELLSGTGGGAGGAALLQQSMQQHSQQQLQQQQSMLSALGSPTYFLPAADSPQQLAALPLQQQSPQALALELAAMRGAVGAIRRQHAASAPQRPPQQ